MWFEVVRIENKGLRIIIEIREIDDIIQGQCGVRRERVKDGILKNVKVWLMVEKQSIGVIREVGRN